jgi:hypothetical protein
MSFQAQGKRISSDPVGSNHFRASGEPDKYMIRQQDAKQPFENVERHLIGAGNTTSEGMRHWVRLLPDDGLAQWREIGSVKRWRTALNNYIVHMF